MGGSDIDAAVSFGTHLSAATKGDAYSELMVGRMYYCGMGVKQDSHLAAMWFQKSLDAGNADGANEMGRMYEGDGDLTTAEDWYRKAADLKDPYGQFNLARVLARSKPSGYPEAFSLMLALAQQGYARAQWGVGLFYVKGLGTNQDYAEAKSWFEKAAAQGRADAAADLGTMYYFGNGVAVDYAEAERWLLKAAENDNQASETLLGEIYKRGRGVEVNKAVACSWFQKAAAQGDARSEAEVALCFLHGTSNMAPDLVQAYMWATLAQRGGFDQIEPVLDNLHLHMSLDQLSAGDKLVEAWKPKSKRDTELQ